MVRSLLLLKSSSKSMRIEGVMAQEMMGAVPKLSMKWMVPVQSFFVSKTDRPLRIAAKGCVSIGRRHSRLLSDAMGRERDRSS